MGNILKKLKDIIEFCTNDNPICENYRIFFISLYVRVNRCRQPSKSTWWLGSQWHMKHVKYRVGQNNDLLKKTGWQIFLLVLFI